MPHILTSKHTDINLCKNINEIDFNFIVKNKLEDKISVSVDNREFLLTKQIKDNNHLIKIDQATRVTPIYFAKQALNSYASICEAKLLFSNTSNNDNKLEPKKEYLKDISYFVNEFKTTKDICVEVGFGSGRHLLYQAQKNPNTIYIGLEIHTPSIEQMLKQVKVLDIKNVYAVNYDARLFLEFLQSNSVSQVFVHFPVPWDKKPHRRVMSNEFIDECLRVLKIDGTLELRTDSVNYYEYSKELLNQYSNKSTIVQNEDLGISSKYEDRWKKQGKDIWDLTIYSNKDSNEISINVDFSFKIQTKIDVLKLEDKLNLQPIVNEDYFVHFNKVYISDDSAISLLSLTMGSFTKPVSTYIIFRNNTVSYYINTPIPTSTNHKAHNLINKLLNEIT